jgi:SAM-dependent methyltransferase
MPLAEIGPYDPVAWSKSIPRRCWVDRDATVVELCRGRRVAHLGAADSPMHEAKARDGSLLHMQVRRAARSVVGFDSNGIDDIVVTDACQPPDPSYCGSFDVVLCCDIIEHVGNVAGLLGACRTLMRDDGLLVITTINATGLKPALRALFGREAVHPEHTAYYTYATLCQLLLMHGFRPDRFGAFSYPTVVRAFGAFFTALARLAPGTADGVLVTTRGRPPEGPAH